MLRLISNPDGKQVLAVYTCETQSRRVYRDGVVYQGQLSLNVEVWYVPGFKLYAVLHQHQYGEMTNPWELGGQHRTMAAAMKECHERINRARASTTSSEDMSAL